MLKIVKLSDIPVSKKNKNDGEVVKFGINSNIGNKLSHC